MSTVDPEEKVPDMDEQADRTKDEPTEHTHIEDDDDDDNSIEARYTGGCKLIKSAMTESYSEILNSPSEEMHEIMAEHGIQIDIPKRKTSSSNRASSSQCKLFKFIILSDLKLIHFRFFSLSAGFPRGSVRVDDSNMTHFVADDLVNKIRIASPSTSKGKQTLTGFKFKLLVAKNLEFSNCFRCRRWTIVTYTTSIHIRFSTNRCKCFE